jgi:peptide deformylase
VIRPILRYGADVLHQPAGLVTEITPEIHTLIDDMVQTMYAAPGIGLAAPQVGVPLRIFVADVSAGHRPGELLTFINPEFVERDGTQHEDEGCLSVPGFTASVKRPTRAVVKGLDRDGAEQTVEGTGLLARCFQHEMDHLEGTIFVDHLRGLQKSLILRKIRKLGQSGKWSRPSVSSYWERRSSPCRRCSSSSRPGIRGSAW